MEYTFRPCTYADVDFIVHLKDLGLRWYIEKIYGWNYDVQKEKTIHEFDRFIKNIRIIQTDGKDIGVTTFHKQDEYYTVGLIIIHPNYQGKGIAREIITSYIELSKQDKKDIKIKVYKENRAQELYKRLGFKEFERDNTHLYMEIKHK